MSIENLHEALEAIQLNIELCDFELTPDIENAILKAENLLETRLPLSFKVFLKKYGCWGIESFEISGIINDTFEKNGIKDSIGITLEERASGDLPDNLIYLSDVGDGFYYYLDSSKSDENGEYPVVIWGHGLKPEQAEIVYEDFGAFLLHQVRQAIDFED